MLEKQTVFYGLWQLGRLGTYGCLIILVASFFTEAGPSHIAFVGAAMCTILFVLVVWYGKTRGLLIDRFEHQQDSER